MSEAAPREPPGPGGLPQRIRKAVASGEFPKARLLWEEYGETFRTGRLRGPLPLGRLAEARELARWTRMAALCGPRPRTGQAQPDRRGAEVRMSPGAAQDQDHGEVLGPRPCDLVPLPGGSLTLAVLSGTASVSEPPVAKEQLLAVKALGPVETPRCWPPPHPVGSTRSKPLRNVLFLKPLPLPDWIKLIQSLARRPLGGLMLEWWAAYPQLDRLSS